MRRSRLRDCVAAAAAVAACWLPTEADENARITRVIDGQTLEVRVLDRTHRKEQVHLLGLQAPAGAYGEKAREYLRILAEGELVDLVADAAAPDRDAEGRLLRYALLLWSLDINAELIRTGHARVLLDTARPLSRSDTYLKLEAGACRRGAGGWGASVGWGTCSRPVTVGTGTPRSAGEPMVYLARRSRRYHTADCPILKGLGVMIPLAEATGRGMKPCKICSPGEKVLPPREASGESGSQ